ncbi:MAG: hypothetical protein LAN83_16040 [Acidobacteriia bacterium]|nr:hypothetical protein [Terriglobia bacterium]
MKVLLLHPEDEFLPAGPVSGWDLVVDLGRAPSSSYENWGRQAGCRVISLYEFAQEIGDLQRVRELVLLGMGRMVDRWEIDWWELLSLHVVPELLQLLLVERLAKQLSPDCELYSSRPDLRAAGLQVLLDVKVTNLEPRMQARVRSLRHYRDAFSNLDLGQLTQVLHDKFDPEHAIRRMFSRKRAGSGQPVVLLPSAYINVSRTALAYAALVPHCQFLLVCGRNSSQVKSLPANVRSTSLDAYFVPANKLEVASLLNRWSALKAHLVAGVPEFAIADALGVLGQIPSLVRWGVALRDAWQQVFATENVTACLCADDSNPYTRIPLILAKHRGLPALTCHHGALDSDVTLKTQYADFYLAKGEMERDYLLRFGKVVPERVVVGAPQLAKSSRSEPVVGAPDRAWLVFFTEPYQNFGWRPDEVYRELLPELSAVARNCGLKLVFKLHPFESVKGHRKLLLRYLPRDEARRVEILAGPPSPQLWRKTRVAMTVQSTVALECRAQGIPVFLCGWLRDAHTGYLRQFERFGIGQVLESPNRIDEIPRLLGKTGGLAQANLWQAIEPETLRRLMAGTHPLSVPGPAIKAGVRHA